MIHQKRVPIRVRLTYHNMWRYIDETFMTKNREEQRGVELLFSALKLLLSSFQMHVTHQRTSHRLPRFDSVQIQEQTTTYGSLYEPNKVTPHHRNYTSFYPKSPKPRTVEALRKNPYRILTNSTPTKFYLTIIINKLYYYYIDGKPNFSDQFKKDFKTFNKGWILLGCHATVCMPGFKPNHGL